jgi:hypothetical protein
MAETYARHVPRAGAAAPTPDATVRLGALQDESPEQAANGQGCASAHRATTSSEPPQLPQAPGYVSHTLPGSAVHAATRAPTPTNRRQSYAVAPQATQRLCRLDPPSFRPVASQRTSAHCRFVIALNAFMMLTLPLPRSVPL